MKIILNIILGIMILNIMCILMLSHEISDLEEKLKIEKENNKERGNKK